MVYVVNWLLMSAETQCVEVIREPMRGEARRRGENEKLFSRATETDCLSCWSLWHCHSSVDKLPKRLTDSMLNQIFLSSLLIMSARLRYAAYWGQVSSWLTSMRKVSTGTSTKNTYQYLNYGISASSLIFIIPKKLWLFIFIKLSHQ